MRRAQALARRAGTPSDRAPSSPAHPGAYVAALAAQLDAEQARERGAASRAGGSPLAAHTAMPPPPELATPVADSLRAWSRASEALLRREARTHAATPVQPSTPPCTLSCTPVPCTPAQPHTPFSAPLDPPWTHPGPTLHPPCTHPAPTLHRPCTSACGSPQEWLLEVVQREAEHRAKDPLSREKGADVAAIRGVQEREAQRAKFEMANKAVRHAMAALDKQNFTLTLRGEAYAEKMLCDQAALERCPGSSLDTSCEQVSFAPTVAPTHAPNLAPTLAPFSPLPSPGTTRRSSCLHSSYRTSPALRRRDTLEVPSWCRHSSLPWPVGAVSPSTWAAPRLRATRRATEPLRTPWELAVVWP